MTTAISNLFTMSMTGFTLGLSILAAQKYGKKSTRRCPASCRPFSSSSSRPAPLCRRRLYLGESPSRRLRTPADIAEFTGQYLRVILLGIPFLAVYNLYSALLRAIGDSRTPFSPSSCRLSSTSSSTSSSSPSAAGA